MNEGWPHFVSAHFGEFHQEMNFLFCFRHSPFYSPDLLKEIKAGLLNFLFCLTRKKKGKKKKKSNLLCRVVFFFLNFILSLH
jgi:hypothetical protein